MSDFANLVEATSALIGAIILPVVILMVFRMFRIEINDFIHRTSHVEGSIGGAKFVADAQRAQFQGAIQKAIEGRTSPTADPGLSAQSAQVSASIAASSVTPTVVDNANGATILWVDDGLPNNNVYERRALEALGVRLVLATTTRDGVGKALNQAFDVVISDRTRENDHEAGFKLLAQLRKKGVRSPFIIYAGAVDPQFRAEARDRGAVDATDRPDELTQLVVSVLNTRGRRPAEQSNAAPADPA